MDYMSRLRLWSKFEYYVLGGIASMLLASWYFVRLVLSFVFNVLSNILKVFSIVGVIMLFKLIYAWVSGTLTGNPFTSVEFFIFGLTFALPLLFGVLSEVLSPSRALL